MKAKDQKAWEGALVANPADMYEGRILRFAEQWAERMEARMEWGEKLAEIAEETQNGTIIRLSGTQLCLAVVALAKHWEHGAELKAWHDKRRKAAREGECA